MREFEELRKSDEDFIIPADHQKRVCAAQAQSGETAGASMLAH